MRRLRERRAAGLIPVEGPAPLALADQLAPAVEESIAALDPGESDQAAAQIARRYAQIIDRSSDQAWSLRWLGPLLLASLESLRATPMSRKERKPAPARVSQLDHLRAARRRPDA
jgi:hypothetical protein